MVLSVDTNILFSAVQATDAKHEAALKFLGGLEMRNDVILSECVLLELYGLLRNPAVVLRPLPAAEAVAICTAFRSHPRWQVVGLPPESRDFHDTMWPRLAEPGFARRKAYDLRTALSLIQQGVDEFATANLKDFAAVGFKRVWNPLAATHDA